MITDQYTYTPERARAASAKGVVFLKERCSDWRAIVDKNKLDMSNPRLCMLGQTAPCLLGAAGDPCDEPFDYHDVVRAFSPDDYTGSDMWAIEHGFDVPYAGNYSIKIMWYEMLKCAWLEQLEGDE